MLVEGMGATASDGRSDILDVSRGWALFVLTGYQVFGWALSTFPQSEVARFLRYFVLEHMPWHGVSYVDTGFPAFLMLMGASLALRVEQDVARGESKREMTRAILGRTFVLCALGFVFRGGFERWPHLDVFDVFYRLGFGYLATGLVLIYAPRSAGYLAASLLVFQWMVFLVPCRARRCGASGTSRSPTSRFGSTLPSSDTGTPKAYLATISAITTCLAGAPSREMGGVSLLDVAAPTRLAAMGVGLLLLGRLWSWWLPMNKRLWTGSFAVYCLGAGVLCWAVVAVLVDHVKKPALIYPLRILGIHSL